MGWLGWNERDALNTDVNSIMIAMEGKLDMMYPEAREKSKQKSMSPDKFKAFAAAHNANREKRKNGKR